MVIEKERREYMSEYLNRDNIDFEKQIKSEIYVDKTDLIDYTNKFVDTSNCYLCVSRPRRFGKSYATNMLVAYYTMNYDSYDLFKNV